MALRNVKLTIAYDGSEYHGWQLQPGCVTVQGVLTEALRNLLGPRARICGASRTDAGVSALGQVGLIQIDTPVPTENFAKAITDRLPESMAIVKAEDVPMGFDVIGDVKEQALPLHDLLWPGPPGAAHAAVLAHSRGAGHRGHAPGRRTAGRQEGFQVLRRGGGPAGGQRPHSLPVRCDREHRRRTDAGSM